jgi:hypothetical protein
MKRAKAVVLDYGGTLVEEAGFDARAGNEWLLNQASYVSPGVTLDIVSSGRAESRERSPIDGTSSASRRPGHLSLGSSTTTSGRDSCCRMRIWSEGSGTRP